MLPVLSDEDQSPMDAVVKQHIFRMYKSWLHHIVQDINNFEVFFPDHSEPQELF